MKDKKLVPELRFPEFEEEWVLDKLKRFTKINQGLQIPISERYNEAIENSYFYITNEFLKEESKKEYYILNPPKSVICEKNDVLMTRTGNTGQVVTGVEGAFHNNFFKIKYDSKNIYKDFLVYFLKLRTTQNIILRYAGTSTIPDLNHGDFYKIEIPVVLLPEQQKIASFLSSVDKRINLLSQKKKKLEAYKKGVMQKLFPKTGETHPEIRFKDENGNEFSEWEEKTLGEIGHFYYGKSAPKHSLSETATTPCIRYGELYTKFNGVIDKIYSYTEIPVQNLKFSKGDEILIPRVGEDPLDFSKCSWLKLKDVAIGEMISVYNTEQHKPFIVTYIRSQLKYEFAKVVEGGNVSNLYFRYLENIKIKLPIKEEQQKIATFLTSIDKKIEHTSKQIEKMQEWKKGLLQKMFV